MIVLYSVQIMRYGQLKFGDFGQKVLTVCSAYFCHLNHFCHSSRLLSIHINHFCQPHRFCQLLSTQSSPILSHINHLCHYGRGHYFCQPVRPLLSPAHFLSYPSMVFSHILKKTVFILIIWFLVNQILPTPICLLFTIRETT